MRIAIIGYGKMGRMIEKIALERGHEITCRIDKDNQDEFASEAFRSSDVAIEFTMPSTAVENISRCFAAHVPVVCGTTGWTSHLDEIANECKATGSTMLWASNFSIGVNIFMAVNRYLARIMDGFPQYTPSLTEVHHIHKLDHPSGTALTLIEQIAVNAERVKSWTESVAEADSDSTIHVTCVREGEVPGIHTIKWDSDVDEITITHSAKSRAGFALGAVMAAEWIAGRKGFFTINEMMADITNQKIFG